MGFGDFTPICHEAAIPLCSVVGHYSVNTDSFGIEAECFARNIELANTIIFQGAASFMHIGALIITVIMILHVRSKFTAVGMLGSNQRFGRINTNAVGEQVVKKSSPSSTFTWD